MDHPFLLYIVNESDQPCIEFLCRETRSGKLVYIHPRFKQVEMDKGEATLLHDFGFKIIEKIVYSEARPVGVDHILYDCKRVKQSRAVYKKDGSIRHWQDVDHFKLIFDAKYNLFEVRK